MGNWEKQLVVSRMERAASKWRRRKRVGEGEAEEGSSERSKMLSTQGGARLGKEAASEHGR